MEGKWINKTQKKNVAVWLHGFLSSGKSCWQSNNIYWPDLISSKFGNTEFDNYVFSYQTSVFSADYSLGDVVDNLKEHLKLESILDYKNIVFICHSMGGIIARKYIVERAVDLISNKNNIGIFLIASPSLGSNYANFFNPIAKIMNHSQADVLRFVNKNPWLAELSKNFKNLKESKKIKIIGKELVEDKFIISKNLFFMEKVVSPISGAQYFGEPIKIPKTDHFSIAKPETKNSFQHKLLLNFLEEIDLVEENNLGKLSIENKLITITKQENLTFGLSLGWHIGRYEFLVDSSTEELKPIKSQLRNLILNLLQADNYTGSFEEENYQYLVNNLLNYYSTNNIEKHSSILLGIAGFRNSLMGVSSNPENDSEIKQLVKSAISSINSTIIKDKRKVIQAFFDSSPETISELESLVNRL